MEKEILVVDDEKNIRELLKFNLEKEGYKVQQAENASQIMKVLQSRPIDLILLDLMLPGEDGFAICRKLKSSQDFQEIPIIMLTARDEEVDKVVGLELGADDYVSKPFSMRELIARIRAVIRRAESQQQPPTSPQKPEYSSSSKNQQLPESPVTDRSRKSKPEMAAGERKEGLELLTSGSLQMNLTSHQVSYHQQDIELTPKEFELLKIFLSHPNQVFTRDNLLDRIWGYDYYGDTRTVDVHIRGLRKKISPDIIKTVRGVGYKLVPLE